MPAKDIYRDSLKNALVKDRWTITHDPLTLKWGRKDIYIDLGAEEIIAAEKSGRRVAVETKSFVGASEVDDLKNAIGQFVLYHDILARSDSDRVLYTARGHKLSFEASRVSSPTVRAAQSQPLLTRYLLTQVRSIKTAIFDRAQYISQSENPHSPIYLKSL